MVISNKHGDSHQRNSRFSKGSNLVQVVIVTSQQVIPSNDYTRVLISLDGLHFGASDLRVCEDDFAWQVQHFVWPGMTFSWQAQYFRQMEWKNRKTYWYEALSSALNFPFLKEVSQNSFVFDVMTLSSSKIEEVSQNCFVFDVVTPENGGSLAELLCFLMLSAWKIEEVSQNSFVFKLADRQIDRQLQLQQRYTTTTTTNTIYYGTLHNTNYTTLHW